VRITGLGRMQRTALVPSPASVRYVAELVWRCALCGYHRLADVRPERCPECHSTSDVFIGRTAVEWRRATL
jgi:rubrerythrin